MEAGIALKPEVYIPDPASGRTNHKWGRFALGLALFPLLIFSCSTTKNLFKRSPSSNPNEIVIRRDLYVHHLRAMWAMECLALESIRGNRNTTLLLRDPWRSGERIQFKHALLNHMSLNEGSMDKEKFLDLLKAGELGIKGLEVLGAMTPALNVHALKLANPLTSMLSPFLKYAEEFRVLMFSYSQVAPSYLGLADRLLWIVKEAQNRNNPQARGDAVVDHVLELARKALVSAAGFDERVQLVKSLGSSGAPGAMVNWTNEEIAFAQSLLVLLLGEGEVLESIRLAKESRPISHEEVAAHLGILGIIMGYDWLKAHFPRHSLSDRLSNPKMRQLGYSDQLPGDLAAEDSFLMMSIRMMISLEKNFKNGGGLIRGPEFVAPLVQIAPLSKSN